MAASTDEELAARLKQGDSAAFDELFQKYRARLYSFLVRLSKRREIAEDLLQETWMRVATRISSLQDDSKLAPWLFAVARNLYGSYQRSRWIAARGLLQFARLRAPSQTPVSPFEALAGDEFEKKIEQALASLPTHSREALLLVCVEGFTPSEAAVVCNLDGATFRKRLSRARAQMAERICTFPLDLNSERPGKDPGGASLLERKGK